jgi:hypothetical protein
MNRSHIVPKQGALDQLPPGPSAVRTGRATISDPNSSRISRNSLVPAIILSVMAVAGVADMHAQTAPEAPMREQVVQIEVRAQEQPAAQGRVKPSDTQTVIAEAVPVQSEAVAENFPAAKSIAALTPGPTPAQMGAILQGQILLMPPDSARTFVPFNNFRKGLEEKHGIGIYAISQTLFARNALSPAVPYAKIAYPGNDNFYQSSSYLTLTYDMRAFRLKGAQLVLDGAIQKVSWYPGGRKRLGSTGQQSTRASSREIFNSRPGICPTPKSSFR